MPAALKVDREAVRTLAVAVGVREAARQLGLNEDRVRQWSCRFDWFKDPSPLPQPPTVTRNDVTVVTKPADALSETLADASKTTRLNLVRAAGKAAETFAKRSGSAIIEGAQALRHVTAAAAVLHSWEEGKTAGLVLNLGLQVNTQK